MKRCIFRGKLWKYPGDGGWHFVYVPDKESKALKAMPRPKKAGFNSIKVRAKIGKTMWNTSLFPSKEGPYLLAIKAEVRKKEGIDDGDLVKVECKIV
ncbi:MAG: hypothetical protein G01um10148_903 [Parcubacteria group bacterium Gr01-1014_8]|nr:MAG: hypothetical protein G01um10148_903 [Parcubacteria group bacterium Gr01-1014_8]